MKLQQVFIDEQAVSPPMMPMHTVYPSSPVMSSGVINAVTRIHIYKLIMEEDIDDLLEEVETKFIKGPCSRPSSVCKQNTVVENHSYSSLLTKASFRVETCDLDDILKDVDEEKSSLLNSRVVTPGHPGTSGGFKCFPVYLGGAGYSAGHSTLSSPRICNNLHCTSCDYGVSTFVHFKWTSSTNYIFLRNNMPDFDKVKSCLVQSEGWNAYACQCSYHATENLDELHNLRKLEWICKGHGI
ncbi:unnamed protein product [Timema podura]|uniref:Cilia- and flagella-associated protein 418 n=1 Tax=Timema podura TaxID=61482 RepID=A0ABN7NL95_TIMPD|nr:unnamed protein product [Timema podura]